MKKLWETAVILFAAMGFWGMIYPDLCFTGDICTVVETAPEDTAAEPRDLGEENLSEVPAAELVFDIYGAEVGQIRLRSRMLEILSRRQEEQRRNEEGYDVVRKR